MSKTLKRFLVVLIVLVIAILSIPKSEKAISKTMSIGNDTVIYGDWPNGSHSSTMGTLANQWTTFNMEVSQFILLNKFVFCLEENQGLPGYDADGNLQFATFDCKWKITIEDGIVYQQRKGGNKTELTGASANFTKGLIYILSDAQEGFMNKHSDGYYLLDDHRTRPAQPKLWKYLNSATSDIKNNKNAWWSDISFDANNDKHGLFSSTDIKEAIEIRDGTKECNITNAEIYIIGSKNTWDAYQLLIIPRIVKIEEDTPNFNFNLRKTDEHGNLLSGAKFDVTISGIKSVTVDGIDYSSYNQNVTVSGTKTFSNIKPSTNGGTITITVRETKAPDDSYEIDKTTYTMNFKYVDGKWKCLDNINNLTTNGNGSNFTLKVVNKHDIDAPVPIKGTTMATIDGYAWVDEQKR